MTRGVYVRRRRDVADRFWEKVEIGPGADDCWLWTGCIDENGYGRFSLNGKSEKAQRVAWLLACGPIPEGRVTRHRCDNPPCVRPAHIVLGTQTANLTDMRERGRERKPHGEQHSSARLTEPQVVEIRKKYSGGRSYRALAAEYGIAHQNIRMIVIGKAWKHVEGVSA